MTMKFRYLLVVGLLILSLVLSINTALADGTVGNGSAASCTQSALRQAVNAGGTITFNCGPNEVVITLTSQINVSKPTVIDGADNNIVISGGGTTRIFRMKEYQPLTLMNLTLRQGFAKKKNSSDKGTGGAVDNRHSGNLTVNNVKFFNNVSKGVAGHNNGGGAIHMHGGLLKVTNSTFDGNVSYNASGGAISVTSGTSIVKNSVFTNNRTTGMGYGGAIFNDNTLQNNRTVKITASRFENNKGRGQGGAVWVWLNPAYSNSKVIVKDSWFIGNRVDAAGSRGGGLGAGLRTGNGKLLLSNTVFVDNNADYQGGGLWVGENAGVNISNVTFSDNTATHGGAIMFVNKRASLVNNTTIAHNHAREHGGGINNYNSGKITLKNSIIAHNTAANQWGINLNCGNTYSSGGNNIQHPPDNTGSNGHNCASDIQKVNPKLAAFDSATGTYPLNGDSPAVDFGSNQTCKPLDQRGTARPQGAKCDSGAYELVSGTLAPAGAGGLIGVPPAPDGN